MGSDLTILSPAKFSSVVVAAPAPGQSRPMDRSGR